MTRKEAILQAATLLFSQKGYTETSTTEISEMTGVAQATVFYHFNSKEKLFLTVLEHTRELITREFESYMGNKAFKNGMDMIENAISFYLYIAGKLENQFLLLHRHYPYKMAETNPICRQHLEAIYDCLVDIFEGAVLLGQQDGSIVNRPARKIALIIFSMADGIVRFKTYNLYDANALFNEMVESCRKILDPKQLKVGTVTV
jgi:AcrR family transcriptional regulator